MSFTWSNQQLAIFDEVASGEHSVLKIKATAGASKTSSLTEAIARYKHHNPEAKVLTADAVLANCSALDKLPNILAIFPIAPPATCIAAIEPTENPKLSNKLPTAEVLNILSKDIGLSC